MKIPTNINFRLLCLLLSAMLLGKFTYGQVDSVTEGESPTTGIGEGLIGEGAEETLDLANSSFYGPRPFAEILTSNFSKTWSPSAVSSIANRAHVILINSENQYCLSVTDGSMAGLQAITVSSLTDGTSTYGRVLRSMFQLHDSNMEVQASESLSGTYSIRPELKIYFAIDADSPANQSSASSTLISRVKAVDYSTITNPSYLVFTFDGTATQTKLKAASRFQYDLSSSTFIPDTSWSTNHWLKIGQAGVELVTLESDASTFMVADATELIDFANNPGEAFNPASIDWQTNSFASWPVNPSTDESDVTALSISHLSAPDGLAYKDIDENYRTQFGTSDEARAVSSAYLDQIEAALNDGNESLRYDKSLYLAVRDNMLSHTFAAIDEENAVLGEPTVPFVYFTNAIDSIGKYHPFMVVGSHNGTGGPNFLIDVARPPGDGTSPSYGAQSVTRNAVLSSTLFKIPLKDYGLVSALADNDLSGLNSLAQDAEVSSSSYNVFNYSSTSVNGLAVDGVKIYPAMNNTLVFAQTNAEITSSGVHVGRGMGLHYHADGHSFNGNGINLYNIEDYEGRSHPPIIGFSLDGLALYGKYESQYSNMDGAEIALDDFGSHSHDGYGQHYHSHEKIVTNEWNGESYEFTEHFMLVGAYKGSINDIPGFQEGGTNQLKDSDLGKYVGLTGTYVNTSFDTNIDNNQDPTAGSGDDSVGGEAPATGNSDYAPDLINGLTVDFHEIAITAIGENDDYGIETVTFNETEASSFDTDEGKITSQKYTYTKTSDNTATIAFDDSGESEETFYENFFLTFSSNTYAEGTWEEFEDGVDYNGTFTFTVISSKSEEGETPTTGEGDDKPKNLEEALLVFDAQVYLDLNSDLKDAFGGDLVLAETHFKDNGFAEGREFLAKIEEGDDPTEGGDPTTGEGDETPKSIEEALLVFDPQVYLDLNPDLKDALGGDLDLAEAHFKDNGFAEGREFLADSGEGEHPTDGGDPTTGEGGEQPTEGQKPAIEMVPMSEVEDFVNIIKQDKPSYESANIVWVEKINDLMDESNFIYKVDLDSGVSLILDNEGKFIHSENSDDFAFVEEETIPEDQYSDQIKAAIETAYSGATIVELVKEFSLEIPENPDQEREFIYFAIIEQDGEKLEVGLDRNSKILLTEKYEESEFEQNEWKPFELPSSVQSYLTENYNDGEDEVQFWADERPSFDGQGMEIVAYLDNGTEVIFDSTGNFVSEFDPWKAFEENLDAGLEFDSTRSSWGNGEQQSQFTNSSSSGLNPAYVHVGKIEDNSSVNDDEPQMGMKSMMYRVSLLNQELLSTTPSLNDFELSQTDLPVNTKLNLTFTYEMGPPRYLIVSGAKVTAFKHRMPDWENPGSFTISAETVAPVASDSNLDGSIASTFGITIEMGGERFYEGAIFETNVIGLDVGASQYSSSWDPVTSFALNGKAGVETSVRAYLPRRLLTDNFGIMDPNDVKAAILDSDGKLNYINGSFEEGAEGVGSEFSRKPYKGIDERDVESFAFLDPTDMAKNEFHLGDDSFGISSPNLGQDSGSPEIDGNHNESTLIGGGEGNHVDGIEEGGDTFSSDEELHGGQGDSPALVDASEIPVIDGEETEPGAVIEGAQEAPLGNGVEISDDERFEQTSSETSPTYTDGARRSGNVEPTKSKFDFNGDQFGDSLLEVSFTTNNFPGEVQIGDPYEDPFANLDESSFGSVSGVVTTSEGVALKDYDVWFFKAPEEGGDIYGGEPVFFNFEINEDGSYIAKLPAGNYHAEAQAYDFSTDTPYKPVIAMDENGTVTFVINDSNSTYIQDFVLEAEFRMSFERASISGSVSKAGQGQVRDVFFELFPVENGERVTDYPVHSFSIDRDGKIMGEAPVGTFDLEVFSHDNSLFMAEEKQITIIAGDVNDLGVIELSERALVSVSGTIKDATGSPIWADVIFVNPNDPEDLFWPMFDEDAENLEEGEFSVKIPEGNYFIQANRFDGLYLSQLYDADDNGSADIVSITAGFADQIDFVLESRPTATLTLQLVDANTSEPIKYGWFDFFDAEDEFGSMIFPDIGMMDFESDDFNGTYNLKIPGGTYKMSIGADGYESVFRIIDESGQEDWAVTTWDQGSSIKVTDGNTTSLGTVSINGFQTSEAERFGFKWLDEGQEPTGFTLKGKVKTNKGSDVPKARIIAHTEDYLFWIDNYSSRADGSFELKNLPAGDWIVFAEPPFDSDAFLSFRESSAVSINLPESNGTAIDLVLQGSNISGRILYPKKDIKSGTNKDKSLSNVSVWAYRDEDGDGEPDYDDEVRLGNQTLSEAYGDTDEDGFFSFYLADAGKYSLRLELPGELSSLAPPPLQFSLRNPADDLQLGNAIRIDWKSDVKATSFDIERKASKESSYKSLFSSDSNVSNSIKPTAQIKSYVDTTITTGETYSYRLIAETTKGKVTLDSSTVRVSKPMIYLAPPSKIVTGRVVDANSSVIAGAEVVAWREEGEGWSSTFSGDDGTFELTAGQGKWEITVYRPFDTKVDWVYDQQPKRVLFKNDNSKQINEVNFTVSRMSGGKIVGSIAIPEGKSASDLAQYVFIDAFSPKGEGNWANPDSSGKFEIPLQPGEYELSIWVDPAMTGFGSPPIQILRVNSNSVDVGELSLTSRDQTIQGVVKTLQDKVLANVEVWAWSEEGGWVSDTTNTSGEYSLSVSPGRWEIGYDLPVAADGSLPPYKVAPPKRIKVGPNDTSKSMDFILKDAGAKIKGVVYGPTGGPVSNLDAWVYVSAITNGFQENDFAEIVAEVPINSRGEFVFPSLPGTYSVGLWLPPSSGFVPPSEKTFTIEEIDGSTVVKDSNETIVSQVVFNLSANDASIEGTFKLNGTILSGLTGEVYAIRMDGEGRSTSSIEDNGTYSLLLSPGNWLVDYYIENDSQSRKLPSQPSESYQVIAVKGQSVIQDFALVSATASISGNVLYDANNTSVTESSLYVWAFREGTSSIAEYWSEVETDENGTYSISVLPGGEYEVGAYLSQSLRDSGYLEPSIMSASVTSGNVIDLNLTIAKPSSLNFISGTISKSTNEPIEGVEVYAWADDGRELSTLTDANGSYELLVTSGSVWHVGAEYGEIDDNGTETLFFAENEVDVDLKTVDSISDLNISLSQPDFEVPDGSSNTFDPSSDFVTKLPDGSELTIPGGAANVSSDVTSVRLVITPTAKGLSKSANEKPADYGYSLELFDNNGKKVEGNFKKDVILTIPIDINASIKKGMDVDNIEAKYYSSTKDAWETAKTSTWDKNSSKLSLTTDHFTTFAAVSAPDVSDLVKNIAKVDSTTYGDWYNLSWLGYFYDASSGWIYHAELGWLYSKEESNGNFWLYESEIGWLWTGPSYFDVSSDSKAFFYSVFDAGWLYFKLDGGLKKFYRYSDQKWILPDRTETTKP